MGNSQVGNDLSSLSDDHVRQLGRIIETLEKSTFDFLQLEIGELKVTVGKGNVTIPDAPAPQPSAAAHVAAAPAPAPAPASMPMPSADPLAGQPAPIVAPAAAQPGMVEIRSPIMGMFYAQPEPSAPAFVSVGSIVQEDSTVGLIEVMKTFNAVAAGVRGRIVEVCTSDSQLVEYGQVLFRVDPAA
jgi:acetyl-CoA carboxylase biotin carboxyl carrier protein